MAGAAVSLLVIGSWGCPAGDADCDPATGGCDAKLLGEWEGQRVGWSVSSAGDTNRDGHADLLVGAREIYGLSRVYLVLGPVTGTVDLADADAVFIGEQDGDRAGWSVGGAGDVDGDGHADVLIGAPFAGEGGAVYLLRGPVSGAVELSAADATLVGEDSEAQAGHSVAGAGDVDGDGLSDVVVGAPGTNSVADVPDGGGRFAGVAYLVRGPITGSLHLADAHARIVGEWGEAGRRFGDRAGASVASAGDVDADGVDDLVVGAPRHDVEGTGHSEVGAAYLVLGPVSGTVHLSGAAAKLVGEADGDRAGHSVSGAGDIDGDGYADLLVGAPGQDEGGEDAGVAYLANGPVVGTHELAAADARLLGGWNSTGEGGGDGAGAALAGCGDVDDDGFDDLLVGSPSDDGEDDLLANGGAAYLVFGPEIGTLDLELVGTRLQSHPEGAERRLDWTGNNAGMSVAAVGDVNSDGWPDLFVGAPGDTEGDDDETGAAFLILGGH